MIWAIGIALVLAGLWYLARVWKPWPSPPKNPTDGSASGTIDSRSLSDRHRNPPKSGPRTTGRAGQ